MMLLSVLAIIAAVIVSAFAVSAAAAMLGFTIAFNLCSGFQFGQQITANRITGYTVRDVFFDFRHKMCVIFAGKADGDA